jgi:DNA modification methylase
LRVPSSWQKFNTEVGLHPTQKSVPLFEYLIRTYSNPGELVLDNCIGSGTTAIACINADCQYIGFEMDVRYFKVAQDRLKGTRSRLRSCRSRPPAWMPFLVRKTPPDSEPY